MLHFAEFFDDIRGGIPVDCSKVRSSLTKLLDRIREARQGTLTKETERALAWNMERANGDAALLYNQNLVQAMEIVLRSIEGQVAAGNIAGVLIDNKLGKHVQRNNVEPAYISEFDKHSAVPYDDLNM